MANAIPPAFNPDANILVGQLKFSDKIYSTEQTSSLIEQSYVKKLSADDEGVLGLEKYFTPLSICVSTPEQYLKMKDSGADDADILHLIDNANLDGYGKRVINVQDPALPSDGATKRYVDELAAGATQKFYYAAAGERNLAQNAIWSTFSFNDSMPQLPDEFILTEIVIPSHHSVTTDQSAYLAIYEYEDESSTPTKMIARSVNAALMLQSTGGPLSYQFNGVKLGRTKYKIGFVDASGEFTPMSVMLGRTSEYTGTIKYSNGVTQQWFIDVIAVGTAKSGSGVVNKLVMTDAGDPSKTYAVEIAGGEWSITEIN